MAKRSYPKIPELSEKCELNWGLLSILESCQGRPGRKLILNGRPERKHIVEYPRKLDHLASFEEECQKIQIDADFAALSVHANAKNLSREAMSTEKHKNKQLLVNEQQHVITDSVLDCLMETHKRTRKKNSQKVYQPSLCLFNTAECSVPQLSSNSEERALNKLTVAAVLREDFDPNYPEESRLSENYRSSVHIDNCEQLDKINMEQFQMRAKAFENQMYIDRKFISKDQKNSEGKPFSDALEVLSSKKGLFIELLREPSAQFKRSISHGKKETVRPVQVSEFEREDVTALPSDKIVVLKPSSKNTTYCKNVRCDCSSSMESHPKVRDRVSQVKITSLTLREMKRKLKYSSGGTWQEPNQFSGAHKLSQSKSKLKIRDDRVLGICRGADIVNSLNSSTNAMRTEKICNDQDPKFKRMLDSGMTNIARKKLDFSRANFPEKKEFDVILEAKRHLAARLKSSKELEMPTGKRSPRTLGWILSSPENDFLGLSHEWESQCFSDSAHMRFSSCSTSSTSSGSSCQVRNGSQVTCRSPQRPSKEATSYNDHRKSDGTLEIFDRETGSSLIQSVEEKACPPTQSVEGKANQGNIHSTDVKSNGAPDKGEMNSFLQPEVLVSETTRDINSTSGNEMQRTDTAELKNGERMMHLALDSLSENGTVKSTVDGISSSPLTINRLGVSDSFKFNEEHQSPVSVLEPCFSEEADSPSSFMLRTDGQPLQACRLDFKDYSFESSPQDPHISSNACIDGEDCVSHYVHLVMQASCLNWDQLSKITPQPEKLLDASLLDEVDMSPTDSHFDSKLLFDHMNEVLQKIHQKYFSCHPPIAFKTPKTHNQPLEELVLDEIMKEADFYILSQTEKRTLDHLVSEDVHRSRYWLDLRLDTEQIVMDISEDFLEESVLSILLELDT